jgi:short-subunit dehydrogenase
MPATAVRGAQVKDGTIQRADIDTTTVGQALIAKLVSNPATTGIALSSTGADAGTGDVTPSLAATIPLGLVTTIYIGSKARLVALANGVQLEVQNSGGTWIVQNQWIEA